MFLSLHHDSLSNNNLKDAVIKHIADVFFTSCSTLDLVMWVHTDNEMSFQKMRLLLSIPTCVCAVCVPVRTENVSSKCVFFSGRSSLFSLNLRSFVHACLSCAYSQVGSEQQLSEGSGISHSEDIYVFKHPGHSCRVRISSLINLHHMSTMWHRH